MKSSDREISGALVIDLGAFSTRAAIVGPSGVSKIESIRTRGFNGYISNLDTLVKTVHSVVRSLSSTVQLPQGGSVPTILLVHLRDSMQFKVAHHEISVSHSSDDGKVTSEQVEKLHSELRDKITGTDGHALFFSVSRYRVVQRGIERDVENPRGLRVDILKGTAVGIVVTRDIYENFLDVFREYNDKYGDSIELDPIGVYSSTVSSALGAVDQGVDVHLHIDLGHTSFRVIKLINGRVFAYEEYNRGGDSIVKNVSSTLSIPPKYGFQILQQYLKEGRKTVQVHGKTIDTAIVEEILRKTFLEFLTTRKIRALVDSNGDRAFTLSVSGGLASYRRINEYISDAGFPEPLIFSDISPDTLVFHGTRKLIEEELLPDEPIYRNGHTREWGWMRRVAEFFKREVLGIEEKGG